MGGQKVCQEIISICYIYYKYLGSQKSGGHGLPWPLSSSASGYVVGWPCEYHPCWLWLWEIIGDQTSC